MSLAVIEACPAHAATITYDFTVDVPSGVGSSGSLVGQYSGFFSYDDSRIFFSDPNSFGLGYTTQPTDFSLNFNNINYTEANLIPYARGRGGTLLQFTPSGETFNLTNFGLVASDQPGTISSPCCLNIYSTGGFDYFGAGRASGSVRYSSRTTPIPEPEDTVYGLVVIGLGWLLRKKIASPKRTSN